MSVSELRARLFERAKELKKQSLFEVLGVSRSASDDEIRRAYFAQVRDFHRDRLPGGAPADARALAEQIETALTSAYDTLSDRAERKRYEKSLDAAAFGQVTDDVGKILAAEGRFRRGCLALERREWDKAETLFREAVGLYADEGDFLSHLGWAMFQRAEGDDDVVQEAERHLQEGLQKNPRSERGWLFLGQLMKATGRGSEAQRQFEGALQCNPDSKEALYELQLLAEQRGRQRVKGGAR